MASKVVRFNEYGLVLVAVVEGPRRVLLNAEVQGCDALDGRIGAIVGDGEQLRTAETILRVPTGSEDRGVIDSDLYRARRAAIEEGRWDVGELDDLGERFVCNTNKVGVERRRRVRIERRLGEVCRNAAIENDWSVCSGA